MSQARAIYRLQRYRVETPALLRRRLDELIARVDKAAREYPYAAEYSVWPGPNSNTFTAWIARAVPELELLLAAIEVGSPTKEEIHGLIGNAPSLRYLAEMSEGALRNVENQWHKIYIGWHSILGQLKVRQHSEVTKSTFASVFGKRDK